MKKRTKLFPYALLSSFLLASCSLDVVQNGALTVAINYDGTDTRITYQMDTNYETPNGTKVSKGDFKPVWRAIQKNLGIKLTEYEDAVASGKAVEYFNLNWQSNQYADIASANVSDINNFSVAGSEETILDLKPYVENGSLPNFAKFLEENPSVKMSIMTSKHSHAEKGAIYYMPYFDGFDDLERMTMVRADFIYTLLDTADTSGFDETYKIENTYYSPFVVNEDNKTAPAYSVTVPYSYEENGETKFDKKIINKNECDNIIYQQNEAIKTGNGTSKYLINQFKNYIDTRYKISNTNDIPFSKYSDLFLDYSSCYDADEMIALMRIIKASPKTLFGSDSTKEMVPFTPRQFNNTRAADLYRWAGQLFGVRGLDSRTGYLYLNGEDEEGADTIHDVRGDEEIVTLLKNLQNIYKEKLILQDFDTKTADGNTGGNFAQDIIVGNGNDSYCGFMEYDYAQSQGAWNDKAASQAISTYDFRPILGGVANWDTNGDGTRGDEGYFHFTESWRSVKTQGIVLKASLVDYE